MKVYLSGRITGHGSHEADFRDAARVLAAVGYEPVIPLDVPACTDSQCHTSGRTVMHTGHTWECYLRHDLAAMLACEAVVMLDGWETSHGARLEHATAVACGLAVWYPPASTLHAPARTGGDDQ